MWQVGVPYSNGACYRLPLWSDGSAILIFEYDLANGTLVTESDPPPSEWVPLVADPDRRLHRSFLFGSEERFEQFFAALDRVSAPFKINEPFEHVTFLRLLDCQVDATPRLRATVLDPLVTYSSLVGHLQWAWHYRSIDSDDVAIAHLDAAVECLASAVSDPYVFTPERRELVADLILVSRARVRTRFELSRTLAASGLAFARADLSQVSSSYRLSCGFAITMYELGLACERLATRQGSVPVENAEPTAAAFTDAQSMFAECVSVLSAHENMDASRRLLMGAAQLALARIANSVARNARRQPRSPRHVSDDARAYCGAALRVIAGNDPSTSSDLEHLLRGCCLAEIGMTADALSAWEFATSTSSRPDVRAAAAFNSGLLRLLEGDLVGSAASLASVKEVPHGYKADFFKHVLYVTRRSAFFLSPAVADSLYVLAYAQPRQAGGGHEALEAAQRWQLGLASLDDVADVLIRGDIVRWRASHKHRLDLLWTRYVCHALDQFVTTSKDSPLWQSGPFPAPIWTALSSASRWSIRGVVAGAALGEPTQAFVDKVLSDAALVEYERRIVTPLRLQHRSKGHDRWLFIPSSSAPASPCQLAHAQTQQPPLIASNRRHPTPGWVYAYDWADLYESEVEFSLLEALLRSKPQPGFEQPTATSLRALGNDMPDLVGVLMGPQGLANGLWVGSSQQQERETRRLHRAVEVMKMVRDFHAHRTSNPRRPALPRTTAAWTYLVTTAQLAGRAFQLSALKTPGIWRAGKDDPRRHW